MNATKSKETQLIGGCKLWREVPQSLYPKIMYLNFSFMLQLSTIYGKHSTEVWVWLDFTYTLSYLVKPLFPVGVVLPDWITDREKLKIKHVLENLQQLLLTLEG